MVCGCSVVWGLALEVVVKVVEETKSFVLVDVSVVEG